VRAEIDEELQSHLDEALEHGRNPEDVSKAFGSALRLREESLDLKISSRIYSLRADAVFGWRQLRKNQVASGAAILSLGLAIGACTTAFRIIDAVLLRPLPISHPERLFDVVRRGVDPGGHFRLSDSEEYPLFQKLRATTAAQAEMIAVSFADRTDLTYTTDEETEKAWRQYVSGWMFSAFELKPALGRLLTASDDLVPGAHPYAVISYDYWSRRFRRDPKVIGRSLRMGNTLYEIVGVAPKGFTGTEPGTDVDLFLPTMMQPYVTRDDNAWLRVLVLIKPGVAPEQVLDRIRGPFQDEQERRAKTFNGAMSARRLRDFLHQELLLAPVAAGVSQMQKDYRTALFSLGTLVVLLLLIACANVANLTIAQAAARSREMALRVSIGAGRARLVQLVLVESGWIAVLAAISGGLFSWWCTPFIVSKINPPDNPMRLSLPADWRVSAFIVLLGTVVALLFGLAPALHASAVRPSAALKGGDDPHSRRRLMHVLISLQAAFCVVVLFVGSLFVATFKRISNQYPGFSSERLLVLDTVCQQPQSPESWNQVRHELETVPGVEAVTLSGWPLLSGVGWNGFISVNSDPPSDDLAYFLGVSSGWFGNMRIALLAGRDLRDDEAFPSVAVVNQAFARRYFPGQDPVGKWFEKTQPGPTRARTHIVGVVADARYREMREPITPTAFVPFATTNSNGAVWPVRNGAFIVRTVASDPIALASTLRKAVAHARPGFRVSNVRTQEEIVQAQTVRERLLAMLAAFFATVALLLAAIGLYGVLDYSVLQRRREIAIRMAVGAQLGEIMRRTTAQLFTMVGVGAVAGSGLGIASARYFQTLLYEVRPTDPAILAIPLFAVFGAGLLSALRPVRRAVTIEPAELLRTE
jgi:predicted permease